MVIPLLQPAMLLIDVLFALNEVLTGLGIRTRARARKVCKKIRKKGGHIWTFSAIHVQCSRTFCINTLLGVGTKSVFIAF